MRAIFLLAGLIGCVQRWSADVYRYQTNAFALEAAGDREGALRERQRAWRLQNKLAKAQYAVPREQFPR